MKFDFSKISLEKNDNQFIEPRKIFLSLKNRNSKFRLPYDVQSAVWEEWFKQRDIKDNIIKINTGGGKTVVALMILQSCLNEGIGPAYYVVPDNYLAEQVENEAKSLGIKVIIAQKEAKYDSSILSNKAIGIITVHTLFNGLSPFNNKLNIGSLVIDDVHACIRTTEDQFSIKIERSNDDYNDIFKIFKAELKNQRPGNFDEIEDGNSDTSILVPYWSWKSKLEKVRKILTKEDYKFNYPLIKDNLEICNCIISTNIVEISPRFPPVEKVQGFENAQRRIFMSATLVDDTIFSSAFNIKNIQQLNIITPSSANDMGERLIVTLNAINPSIKSLEIKEKLAKIAQKFNVVVLVPSSNRALQWEDVASEIVDKNNISDVVKRLKNNEHLGIIVFVNRYDGVDLNDAACRVLVIDGLPPVAREFDKIEKSAVYNSDRIVTQQIQKIEQGMGRGVRSNLDYCAVLLLTNEISSLISIPNNKLKFSKVTRAQMDLCEQMIDEFKIQSLDEIFELVDLVLTRNPSWTSKSNEALSNQSYDKNVNLDFNVLALKKSYDLTKSFQFEDAYISLRNYINKTDFQSNYLKGFMLQSVAELRHFSDQVDSQVILKSAVKHNYQILRPQDGFQLEKKLCKYNTQQKNILAFCKKNNYNSNDLLKLIYTIKEKLIFEPDTYDEFEKSLCELGSLLGFDSTRPEKINNGSDVMWRITESTFLIYSCKNGATTKHISRKYADGLSGHINWFESSYGDNSYIKIPIMIFPSNILSQDAHLPKEARIIDKSNLEDLNNSLVEFGKSLATNELNEEQIKDALLYYHLNSENFTTRFTCLSVKEKR